MSYFNPYDHPITADLRLTLVGVNAREIAFEHAGRVLRTTRVGEAPVVLNLPQFVLAPGVNTMALRSREPAVRTGVGRYQLRTFGLQDSSIRVVAPVKPLD